jgi:hypothetical protein
MASGGRQGITDGYSPDLPPSTPHRGTAPKEGRYRYFDHNAYY